MVWRADCCLRRRLSGTLGGGGWNQTLIGSSPSSLRKHRRWGSRTAFTMRTMSTGRCRLRMGFGTRSGMGGSRVQRRKRTPFRRCRCSRITRRILAILEIPRSPIVSRRTGGIWNVWRTRPGTCSRTFTLVKRTSMAGSPRRATRLSTWRMWCWTVSNTRNGLVRKGRVLRGESSSSTRVAARCCRQDATCRRTLRRPARRACTRIHQLI